MDVFHLGASSGFVSFRNLQWQEVPPSRAFLLLRRSVLPVQSVCPQYLLRFLCVPCYPIQTGHFAKAEAVAQTTPSASFSRQKTSADGLSPARRSLFVQESLLFWVPNIRILKKLVSEIIL